MIIGVTFDIEQCTGKMLWQILKCIDIESYIWYVEQDAVYTSPSGETFFKKDSYDGSEFLKLALVDHYIIFLKAGAYLKNGGYFDIKTYEDFVKSDCQLLLLICDCEYVDIYAKDKNISKAIYENAIANNFTNLEYVTEENDGRTGMDV
ncbi:MAG: DUF2691 family protein [Oscillospiraceae bacterium]|jgi:hypothetical protein|nr:DUF2691 family protein [Oscillospiraceae bacterium]